MQILQEIPLQSLNLQWKIRCKFATELSLQIRCKFICNGKSVANNPFLVVISTYKEERISL